MTIDQRLFRDIMSGFPSGVTVVTAMAEDGEPSGMTVSAFCSVSLEPPLVMVSIDRTAATLAAIRHSLGYTVNFLAAGQDEMSNHFAAATEDKFSSIEWTRARTPRAGPILDGVINAYVECEVAQEVQAGDHWIFIGRVELGWKGDDGEPLVHWQRRYWPLREPWS